LPFSSLVSMLAFVLATHVMTMSCCESWHSILCRVIVMSCEVMPHVIPYHVMSCVSSSSLLLSSPLVFISSDLISCRLYLAHLFVAVCMSRYLQRS
jgi:hypothetical protein